MKKQSGKQNPKYDVSVIIVNYLTYRLIEECIKTIFQKTSGLSFEIVIVDNSNDLSEFNQLKNLVNEFPLPIKVINARGNLGFGRANNLGASYSNGDYLLFLNSDTLLINNAMLAMIRVFKNYQNVGCVGANLYTKSGKPEHSYIKAELTKKGIRKNNSLLATIARKLGNSEQFNRTGKVLDIQGYLTGACFLVPTFLFNEIGGFDQDIFMYGEDSLLCNQIRKKGYRLVNTPDAKVIHLNGASDSTIYSDKKILAIVRGNSICLEKMYGVECLSSYLYVYYKSMKEMAFWNYVFGKKNNYINLKRLAKAYKQESVRVATNKNPR